MKKARVYETPTQTQEDTLSISNVTAFVVSDEGSLPFALVIESDYQSPVKCRTNTASSDMFSWALNLVYKEFGADADVTVFAATTPRFMSVPDKNRFHSCTFKLIAEEANPAGPLLSESWFW